MQLHYPRKIADDVISTQYNTSLDSFISLAGYQPAEQALRECFWDRSFDKKERSWETS